MSKSKISQLTDPKRVAEAAKDRSSREHAMLRGALGAIEKGGTTVPVDESTVAKATHYGRVLSGADEQKLGEKHYGEIAKLVETFLVGPQKVRKVSSMEPSEIANHLRRIALAIENSKSPSRELVLKDIQTVINRIASKFDKAHDKLKSMDSWQKRTIHNDIARIVEECSGARDEESPYSCVNDDELMSLLEYYENWTVGDFRALAVGMGMAEDFNLDVNHYS